jgi:hypothetical protein
MDLGGIIGVKSQGNDDEGMTMWDEIKGERS